VQVVVDEGLGAPDADRQAAVIAARAQAFGLRLKQGEDYDSSTSSTTSATATSG